MTLPELFLGLMFLALFAAILSGIPAMLAIAGAPMAVAVIGSLFGAYDPSFLRFFPARIWGIMSNGLLMAVPLFVLMGVLLERAKLAEQMLGVLARMMGGSARGMALSVLLFSAMIAAATGIIGATIVMLVLVSLRPMLEAGIPGHRASGLICASGTLGQIIPPSILLVLLGDQIGNTYLEAQQRAGNFAPMPVSVGDLFAGALLPGFLLVGLYLAWVIYKSIVAPESCPATPAKPEERGHLLRDVVVALVPPLALIAAVLGSILGGIATPTEAASVGAVGATLLAALRWRLSPTVLREAVIATATITSMVFIILFGASVFSIVFRLMGGDNLVHEFLADLPGGVAGAVIVVMAIMFLLGFILDTFEIIFIVIPITAPILLDLGVDPVWLGVMVGVNLQTSFLTPPFGFALFYLRGVAPDSVSTGMIYRGVLPFVVLQVVALFLMFQFPAIATWLPRAIYG